METSPFFDHELLSHPDRTLYEHVAECDRISAQVLSYKNIREAFFSKDEIITWLKLLVWYHDFGKGTDFFQHRIIDVITALKRESKSDSFIDGQQSYISTFKKLRGQNISDLLYRDKNLGSHSRLGAYYLFGNFSHDDPVIEVIMMKIVQRHHGHLTNFLEDKNNHPVVLLTGDTLELLNEQIKRLNFELYNKNLAKVGLPPAYLEQWENIKFKFSKGYQIAKWSIKLKQSNTYRYFFLQHYLFSLLLSADKGDMKLPRDEEERGGLLRKNQVIDSDNSLVERFKTEIFKNAVVNPIDDRREQAFADIVRHAQEWSDCSFFSITLPTGMGKTFAAFKAAFLLQKKVAEQSGTVPHIIYCLPFTSVIDQNAALLEKIFEFGQKPKDWISVHHYLSIPNENYDNLEGNEYELGFQASEYMTEGWEQDVIATTFVQFLESIFTNKNRALRKFHNLVHAVVVLDEVQAIPPKYFGAVEDTLKCLSDYFGTKFLFVTATQPLLFSGKEDIIELTDPSFEKTNDYFRQMSRIELDQSLLKQSDYSPEEDENRIEQIILDNILENPEKSFLIICNTIRQSQRIFAFLTQEIDGNVPIRYLSSSIIPYCRRKLIEKIKAHKSRQILVSTQVVEAGVDIDFDVVYRDWAPLDAINQSAGRCNRNALNRYGKGRVKLFHSGKAQYIYDSKLLGATKDVLREFEAIIPEELFLELNNEYAHAVRRAIAEENPISEKIKTAMKNLQLEEVDKLFELISDDQQAYTVFIPYQDNEVDAMQIWSEYLNTKKISNNYERKAMTKRILPRLLPFATRFPKNKYSPPPGTEKDNVIFEPNWHLWYDEILGFKQPGDQFF